MFTINYKGFYIHGYIDKAAVKFYNGELLINCGSMHAAKLAITKFLKKA